jgi:hypothetical protein
MVAGTRIVDTTFGSFKMKGMVMMESTAYVFPLTPGKSDDARLIFSESMGKRRTEFAQSCNRSGIAREYAWIQRTPPADLLIIEIESDDISAAIGNWATANESYDTWLKEQLHYVTGIDLTKPEEVPPCPKVMVSLQADAVAHAVPIASALPLLEGKTAEAKEWFEELKGPRCDELRDYLVRGDMARETWYLQTASEARTAGGDILITTALVEDPDGWYRGFSRSGHPFDKWLKAGIAVLTGIDLNAPETGLTPEARRAELVLDWHHAFQAAA